MSDLTPAQIKLHQKQDAALSMRVRGISPEEIALKLGFPNAKEAGKAVHLAARRNAEPTAQEMRRMEDLRLDVLVRELNNELNNKPPQPEDFGMLETSTDRKAYLREVREHRNYRLALMDRVLAVMKRRAKMWGLDLPSKKQVEITGASGGPIQTIDLGSASDDNLRALIEGLGGDPQVVKEAEGKWG